MTKQSKNLGRPTKLTPNTIRKLEEAFKCGLNVVQACSVSGISKSVYYDHLAKDEDFSDKMVVAQEWTTMKAKRVLAQPATFTNQTAF